MENKEHIIRRIAGRIIKKYNLYPPINFSDILKDKNIQYLEENLGTNGDGYSDLRDSALKIIVNSEIDYLPRKRFTIAHELGHVFIGWHDDVTLCKTENEFVTHNMLDIQEKEANVFASELLMPNYWVKEQLSDTKECGLDLIIDRLSSLAQTSIMATMYALENALESGNAFIVYSDVISWGKRFVATNTCERYLRGKDFIESCYILCERYCQYSIGSYSIVHFSFMPYPNVEDIKRIYEYYKDLTLTLKHISGNSILSIIHCIISILNVIADMYTVCLFEGKNLLLFERSKGVEVQLPYTSDKSNIIETCIHYGYNYKVTELEDEMCLLVITEPIYRDVKAWVKRHQDSKLLCNEILNDLYYGEELKKKRMSISGVIGSANGTYKQSNIETLYDLIQKRLRRREFDEFIEHNRFNDFVSLKCYELINRR
jgi:Zn-dependent peptidase ImmA (M78 family)